MRDANELELQAAFLSSLSRLGLPQPNRNVVPQCQWIGDDLVLRARFPALRQAWWKLNGGLSPTAECRYEGARFASRSAVVRWVKEIAAPDCLGLVYAEMRRKGFAWPREWPRPDADSLRAMSA